MAAAARPLTAAALTNTAEPARKFLRDSIVLILLLVSGHAAGFRGNDHCRFPTQTSAAEHSDAKIGRCQPEIALGFDARDLGLRLGSRSLQQREGIDLHGVEL